MDTLYLSTVICISIKGIVCRYNRNCSKDLHSSGNLTKKVGLYVQ